MSKSNFFSRSLNSFVPGESSSKKRQSCLKELVCIACGKHVTIGENDIEMLCPSCGEELKLKKTESSRKELNKSFVVVCPECGRETSISYGTRKFICECGKIISKEQLIESEIYTKCCLMDQRIK